MDKLSWSMLLLLSFFLGQFFLSSSSRPKSELTPWDIVALRCLFGMLSLSPFVLVRGLRARKTNWITNLRPYLVHFFILGSLNLAVPFLLITHGQALRRVRSGGCFQRLDGVLGGSYRAFHGPRRAHASVETPGDYAGHCGHCDADRLRHRRHECASGRRAHHACQSVLRVRSLAGKT